MTLTDEGGASLGAIDSGSSNVDNLQITGDNINYFLTYEVNNNQGGQVFHNLGSVDSGGNLFVTMPFAEKINSNNNTGERKPPSTAILYASGVAGVCFRTSENPWAIYQLVDTNSDGIKDAVDPSAYDGHRESFGLEVLAPQASNMTAATVEGDYGSVALVNLFTGTDGHSAVYTNVAETTLASDATTAETQMDAQIFTRTPAANGSATLAESSDNTLSTGSFNMSANGQFTFTEDGSNASFFGFASNNGELIFSSVSEGEKTGPDFSNVSNGITLNVKKPATTPDLSGRTYRLMGIEKQMSISGRIRIQRVRGDDDRLIFNGDGSQVSITYHGIDRLSRNADNDDFSAQTDPTNSTVDLPVAVASNGAINFTQTAAGTNGFTREWKGFVSASNNIIILRSIKRATNGTGFKIGIFVAIPVL